jgi:hypothetical protein
MEKRQGEAERGPHSASSRSVEWGAENLSPLAETLPHHLVVGNRFGAAGLICGVAAQLLALLSILELTGWLAAAGGVILASIGFVKYCKGGATNRDAAIVGGVLAWLALVVLFARASGALQLPGPVFLS